MQLRIALALTAVSIVALMAACAGQQSLSDMARAACEEENTPAAEMAACIEETRETLRRAREYSPPPPAKQR